MTVCGVGLCCLGTGSDRVLSWFVLPGAPGCEAPLPPLTGAVNCERNDTHVSVSNTYVCVCVHVHMRMYVCIYCMCVCACGVCLKVCVRMHKSCTVI